MSYVGRIRHPSGALNPPRDKGRTAVWRFWVLVGLVLLLYFGWREGMFRKLPRVPLPPPANPLGWR